MLTWKFVMAGIIAAYLLLASAVSMMVQSLASAPPPVTGAEETWRAVAAFAPAISVLLCDASNTGK